MVGPVQMQGGMPSAMFGSLGASAKGSAPSVKVAATTDSISTASGDQNDSVRAAASNPNPSPRGSSKVDPNGSKEQAADATSKTNAVENLGRQTDIQTFLQKQQAASLSFSEDKDLNIPVTKLVDTKTKQVIWQVPPAELLAVARRLQNNGGEAGQVIDRQV